MNFHQLKYILSVDTHRNFARAAEDYAISQAKPFLDAGAYIIMMESEGVTENANPWKVGVPAKFINELGLENVMFEAADPQVFKWYLKNYGSEVNLFVDHSQIVQLECIRQGIWGTKTYGAGL